MATVDLLLGGFEGSPYSLALEDAPPRLRALAGILATLRDPIPGFLRRLTVVFLEKKLLRFPMSSVDFERGGVWRLVSLPLVVRLTPRDAGGRRGDNTVPFFDPDVAAAL